MRSRAGRRPCDPTTLLEEPCIGECGRQLHRRTRGEHRVCTEGHPPNNGGSICSGCRAKARARNRAEKAVEPVLPVAAPLKALVPPRWAEEAACVGADPTQFFLGPQHQGRGTPVEAARARLIETAFKYCGSCPVIAECAATADANLDQGLFAGALRRARGHGVENYSWQLLIPAAPEPRPVRHPSGVTRGQVA